MMTAFFFMLLIGTQLTYSTEPGTRLWDLVNEDLKIDTDNLSKVCMIDSKIDQLELCEATPITNDNPTIGVSGSYCLAQNITGTLTITADNVVINLNGLNIDGGFNGICIESNLHNITIKNGTVRNITEQGIIVNEGCKKIVLENLLICNCAQEPPTVSPALIPSGIAFLGAESNHIEGCRLSNVTITDCSSGAFFQNISCLRVQDCNVFDCSSISTICAGFGVIGTASIPSNDILFENCFVSTITSSTLANGIINALTTNILIDGCTVDTILSRNEAASGFESLSSSEISILNCGSYGIESLSSSEGAQGFSFGDCSHMFLDHCITLSISAINDPVGFEMRRCTQFTVKNCSAENISTASNTTSSPKGFNMFHIAGMLSKDIILQNCCVSKLQSASLAGAVGFNLMRFSNAVFDNCVAMGLESTGPGNSSGFNLSVGEGLTINNCVVQQVSGNNAAGFNLSNIRSLVCNQNISTNILSNVSPDSFINGFAIRDIDSANICNCLSSYNHAFGSAIERVVGFDINLCDDIYLDFCKTTSNFAENAIFENGNGFNIANSGNIVLEQCASSYNTENAFELSMTATNCLVGNCIATHSERGFVDFSSTSTFYNNVASKNTVAHYVGVPFIVTQGSAVIAGGNLEL